MIVRIDHNPQPAQSENRRHKSILAGFLSAWVQSQLDASGLKNVASGARIPPVIRPSRKLVLASRLVLTKRGSCTPGHPYLLEANFDGPGLMLSWVRKPLLGREGANITLHQPGQDVGTPGGYGAEGFIYQDLAPLKSFDGLYPVAGSWVIGHEEGNVAAGMGIRESDTPIITNLSQFVPHLFD